MSMSFVERLRKWKQESFREAKKKWWWVLIVAPIGSFLWALGQDRVVRATNKFIDDTVAGMFGTWHLSFPSGLGTKLLTGALLSIIILVAMLLVHAYWETRPSRQKGLRTGQVRAYGEIRHPFPMSDRDPRITIEFDKSPAPMGKDSGFRNRQILLRNDGGIDAFKVQVSEITLTSGRARFDEVPQIRPQHGEPTKVVIVGPEGQEIAPFAVHDLELLMGAEINKRSNASDWSPFEVKCRITYRDHAARHFITHATLCHDMTKGLTSVKDYEFFELRLAEGSRCGN